MLGDAPWAKRVETESKSTRQAAAERAVRPRESGVSIHEVERDSCAQRDMGLRPRTDLWSGES